MQEVSLFPTIGFMKTFILWTITILALSSLFLLIKAPLIGALFLFFLFIFSIILSFQKKKSILPPVMWLYPKIVLAFVFLSCIGYSIYLYLKNIQCVSCMHGILAANLPMSLSYAEDNIISFLKGLWALNNRVCFFFLFIGFFIILHLFSHFYKKEKGRSHA